MKDLSDIPLHEVYETLCQNEEEMEEKRAEKKKAEKVSDPIALVSGEKEKEKKEKKTKKKVIIPSSDSDSDSDSDDGENLKQAMLLLTRAVHKKFYKKPGSNTQRYSSSGSKNHEHRERVEGKRYEENRYVDRKSDEKKKFVGHYAKDCRKPKVRNSEYYKNKMLLAKQQEAGKALMVEDGYWLDHSDEEEKEESSHMCLMGHTVKYDDSDDETADEVLNLSKYDFMVKMEAMMVELQDLQKKLKKEKSRVEKKNQKIFDLNKQIVGNKDLIDSPCKYVSVFKQEKDCFENKISDFESKLSKMSEGSPVGTHMLKMIGHIERLEGQGFSLRKELAIDVVLQSLPNSYSQFVMNYNMRDFEKSLPELLNMLRTAEQELAKNKSTILMVRKDKKGKGKGKSIAKPTSKSLKPKGGIKKPKVTVPKEGECFHCNKLGHWKRNCLLYLQEKKKGSVTSTSGIYVIEANLSTSYTSWVLDIGCGSHICRNVQELKRTRRLSKGEVDLRVGNGTKVAAIAVGSILLTLPTGLLLELDDCYCVPSISRNLISVSCLDKKGFSFSIGNKCCSFSFGNIYYGDASLINGLYVLNMDNPIYNIDKRDVKSNSSNLTYLWHCRLGHINETRISKLHKDGLLNKLDFESYGTCEACLIGKMTKAPFVGQSERASDVLGIIHSDVCGPMNIHARGGYRYFITFTDDLSRFGYKLWYCITTHSTWNTTMEWCIRKEELYTVRHGYPKETMGYCFYHPHDNKVFVGRAGVFMEKEFISKGISGRNVELEVVQDQNISTHMELTQTPQVIVDPQSDVERQSDVVTQSACRSSRKWNEPERYGFLITHTGDL
ncbi:hypothetical protein L6452_35025 [Arctium lappa]|uniref:Uncharacterized protein n=1 Tax=Arctium lappa TaxID=4217 RepID=A0ACB8YKH9_ARCLA|nr:hypothetical protein L6452_35025 [Arctium lappa]